MNKNIKRTIAVALAIGAFSTLEPTKYMSLMTTKASASSDDADELTELKLETSGGSSIKLYSDDDYDSDNKVDNSDVEEGETYYAKTSSSKIKLEIDGADEDNVRIFKGSTAYEVGDNISISSGSTTTLKVRVYEDEYDSSESYSSSDYNQYTIKVENTDDDENDVDELDSLELLDSDNDNIDLYEDDNYDEDIDSDEVEEGETYYTETSSDEVSIETDGPDDNCVKIFKSTSDSAEGIDPGDSISLTSDKTLTVRIYSSEPDSDVTYGEDDDVIGEYKIKVEYTGDDEEESTSTSTTTTTTAETTTSNTSTIKANQWVQVNGKWQYNDALGSPLKNAWFSDKDYGKAYYLQADGNMAIGWLNNSGSWYYLDSSGAKQTGWQSVGGTWYYLDSEGKMQTGWFKDTDGNWYYLQSSGAMAKNTTISGYKLGANGALVK